MHLTVDGITHRVGQLGPGFVILDNPIDQPPAVGQMTLSIDGEVEQWQVHLPDGISSSKRRTTIVPA